MGLYLKQRIADRLVDADILIHCRPRQFVLRIIQLNTRRDINPRCSLDRVEIAQDFGQLAVPPVIIPLRGNMCLRVNPNQVFLGLAGLLRLKLEAEKAAFAPQESRVVVGQKLWRDEAEVEKRLPLAGCAGGVLDFVDERSDGQLLVAVNNIIPGQKVRNACINP